MRFRSPATGTTTRRPATGALLAVAVALTVPALGLVVPADASAASQFTPGEGTGKAWCPGYGGTNLGSYKDVYACKPKAKTDGKTPFDSYSGFQCTELANRFLYTITGRTLFDNEEGGNFVELAAAKYSIADERSGAAAAVPSAGDIISMWGGRSGQKQNGGRTEVAVVTKVSTTSAGWTITTLNQGDPSDTDGRDGINTITVSANGRTWSTEDGFYTSFDWLKLFSSSATGTGGTSWAATEAPLHSAIQTGQLLAVACRSATNCTAVGDSGSSPMLVYRSGASWKAATAPAPSTAATEMRLTAVTCPAADGCLAAGQYHSQERQQGVLLTGHAADWTATRSPLPGSAASQPHVVFTSVACLTASSCVAVGEYTAAAGTSQGLIVVGHGTSWTAYRAPLPGDARAKPSAELNSVACVTSGRCTAAGHYFDTAGNEQGLIVTGSGSSWTGLRAALPASAVTPGAALAAVTCPSAADCAVAGTFSANKRGMVLTGSGSSWHAVATPLPGGAAADPATKVRQIVCSTSTECVVVGSYQTASDGSQGLLLGGHGTSWKAARAPLPADAAANQSAPGASLMSLACAAAASCVAAGQYTDTAGDARVLMLYWHGSSWAASSGPLPANNRTVGAQAQGSLGPPSMASATCPSASACFAVGTYPARQAGMEGLVETGRV